MAAPSLTARGGPLSSAIAIALVAGIVICLNVIAGQHTVRVDLTSDGRFTVGDTTRRIVGGLESDVTLRVYLSRDLPARLLSAERRLRDLLAELEAIGSERLRIEVIDPDGDPELVAELKRQDIVKLPEVFVEADEQKQVFVWNSIAIHCEDRRQVVPRVLRGAATMEYELAVAIRRVSGKRPPTVGFLAGHGEPTAEKGRQLLTRQLEGLYAVRDVDTTSARELPPNLDALIVIGPSQELTEAELFLLDQFVMQGGALVFCTDGLELLDAQGKARPRTTGVERLLATWGLKVEPAVIADERCGQMQVPIGRGVFQLMSFPYMVQVDGAGLNREVPPLRRIPAVLMLLPSAITIPPWARAQAAAGPGAAPADERPVYHELLFSSPRAWASSPPLVLDPRQIRPPPSPAAMKRRLLAAAVKGKLKSHFAGKEAPALPPPPRGGEPPPAPPPIAESTPGARVVVIGSALFTFDRWPAPVQSVPQTNLSLVQNILDWLILEDDLIDLRPTPAGVSFDREKNTPGARTAAYAINIVLLPLVVVVAGLVRFGMLRVAMRRETRAATAGDGSAGQERTATPEAADETARPANATGDGNGDRDEEKKEGDAP